jgi:predicted ester cyclase
MMAPNYERHSQATTGMPEIEGVEAMLGFLEEHVAACPDGHEEIELMIADGDLVRYITTCTGTNSGAMGGVPPPSAGPRHEE